MKRCFSCIIHRRCNSDDAHASARANSVGSHVVESLQGPLYAAIKANCTDEEVPVPVSSPTIEDWEAATRRGLGQPCQICSDEDKLSTHIATPCAHSACASCWDTWQANHSKCMICNLEITSVKRAPLDIVNHTNHERARGEAAGEEWASLYMKTERVDILMVKVITKLVDTKHQLQEAKSTLEASVQHMMIADEGVRGEVLTLEGNSVASVMNQLNKMADVGVWAGAAKSLEQLKDALVEFSADMQGTEDKAAAWKQVETRLSSWVKQGGTWKAQWRSVGELCKSVFGDVLPQAVYNVGQVLSDEKMVLAITAMSELEAISLGLQEKVDVAILEAHEHIGNLKQMVSQEETQYCTETNCISMDKTPEKGCSSDSLSYSPDSVLDLSNPIAMTT